MTKGIIGGKCGLAANEDSLTDADRHEDQVMITGMAAIFFEQMDVCHV